MTQKSLARPILLVAGLYDIILGLSFAFFYAPIFSMLSIPLPAEPVYLIGSALLIAIVGCAFLLAWRNPKGNADIWLFGIIFKLCYALFAGYFVLVAQQAPMVFLYFGIVDVLFLLVFAWMKYA